MNRASIGSDNGLSPDRRQAIIWPNAGILLLLTMGINFSEILVEINTFSFTKMHLKISSVKWPLFRLGLNVLRTTRCWAIFSSSPRENSLSHYPWAPHDDVIKWKHFPNYWPFVRGIHRSPVNSPQQRPVTRNFDFSLICTWTNEWVNNRHAGDLRRHRAHYNVTVMEHIVQFSFTVMSWACFTFSFFVTGSPLAKSTTIGAQLA